jgi:hypothetical protein
MARKTHVTPAGVALWPRLSTPDTKFNKDGEYKVKLELGVDDDGVPELLQLLDELLDASWKEAVKDHPDKEIKTNPAYAERDDGTAVINFKCRASGTRDDRSTWEFRPALFDAKGAPIKPSQVMIGSGSIMKVSFTTRPYYNAAQGAAGISLSLQAVQLLKLEEYGGRAEDHGFGEEEGYEVASVDKNPWDAEEDPREEL